ncbi:5351_t:CDS:2, partial [Funneliformis caledonium]
MLRSLLGGTRKQGPKRAVVWSPDVVDNAKPLPDSPKTGMSDDEAIKKSGKNFTVSDEDERKRRRAIRFGATPSENDNSIGQESTSKVSPLSDFAVEQAAQISNLTENERKRQRAVRFGTRSLQSQQSHKSKTENSHTQELEQLGTRVKDFVDTTRLYAQVQDAISDALNEATLSETGRSRAWDYFHDGFKVDHKAKRRESVSISETDAPFEFQVEPQVVHEILQGVLEDTEKVNNNFGLKLENDSTAELDCIPPSPRYADIVNAKEVQSSFDEISFVPDALISKSNENSPVISSVNYEEETIAASIDENTLIETTDTDAVLGPPPSAPFQFQRETHRREQAFKRKVAFKKFAIKKMIDRESAELSRRRKYRMAIFDANRAHSVATVLGELDSVVKLDTPAERLFRLEHPEYFPKEPSESREERLREYEEARSSYDAMVAKKMVKQQSRQDKLDDDLQETKKVARQKVQEEKNRIKPSESDTRKSRKEKGNIPSDKEDYDDDESEEEFDAFEELSVPLQVRKHTLRRKKDGLSYNELRRQVKEKERSEKVQRELAKIQEKARKCQIEDLRHQILEEERNRKRQKLVDLSNERDRRDAITIQHIREVAATKIAIGRAIRELEDKISAAEVQLQEKS